MVWVFFAPPSTRTRSTNLIEDKTFLVRYKTAYYYATLGVSHSLGSFDPRIRIQLAAARMEMNVIVRRLRARVHTQRTLSELSIQLGHGARFVGKAPRSRVCVSARTQHVQPGIDLNVHGSSAGDRVARPEPPFARRLPLICCGFVCMEIYQRTKI